jgi:hypothetical protein
MSCLFQVEDNILWEPSNTVARLFKGHAEAIAAVFDLNSGLGAIIEDECEIDLSTFEKFLAEVVRRYHHATHPILRSLTVGVIVTASVLIERAGGKLPEAEPEQLAEWSALRREYSRSMPR